MTPTIREKVLHCSRLFKSVSVESGELKDVSQHFVNWYSNIAAHRAGPASLDERLRDAPDVRAAILRFLDILIKMFDDYKFENTSGDINNSSKNHTPLDMLVYNAASSKPITLMYKVIDCLKRITVAIRAPASVDRYKKARNFDIDYYRPTDRSHIMELFPAADPILQDRLLEAVLSRRRFLRYTQDHRKKLGHKSSIQNDQNVGERIDAEENSEFADTVATPITPGTALEDYSPMELCDDDRSVYSNSSSLRSDTMARVPSMPLEGQSGKPFECPCCFLMMEVKNREQWKRHVTSDMRPYVCTFTGCKVPDTLFPSRHGWYSHEIAFHRRKWFCVSGCSLQFDSRELFDSHVKASHRELLKTADAETHGAYSRQLPEHQATSCPLCHEELQNSKLAERHIGRHLLQLGMWPLRSMREFEDDDNQQECEEADSEVDDSEEVDKEEEMRDDEEMEKEKADNTTAVDKHLQMKQSGEIKSRREADNEVQEALRTEFLERLKIIGREEQKQFALESTVDIPMSPEEYAETAEKLKRIVVDMGKVGRGLVKWYSITQDDARAKMFFRLRLRVIKQHVDGDEMKVVKDVFSIRSSELDQARAMLESMAKDLAANFALSRQQTQQAQQKNLTQPAPLMPTIPKMI